MVPPWTDSYGRVNTSVHVHLLGWRRTGEGPSVNICVRFQRDPERGVLLESETPIERGDVYRQRGGVYQMQRSVLVEVVEGRYIREYRADGPHSMPRLTRWIPSTVRLQPLDCCPFSFPESPDVVPLFSGLVSSAFLFPTMVQDRELRVVSDTPRNAAAPPSLMKLEDEMVQSRPKVVERLTDKERPLGPKWLDLSEAKAVFQSVVMTLGSNGPELVIDPPMEFVFEGSVVLCCPTNSGYWTFQAPCHDLTLDDDSDVERGPGAGLIPSMYDEDECIDA
jgi:hypothetical protein